jgi:hypothetical protein
MWSTIRIKFKAFVCSQSVAHKENDAFGKRWTDRLRKRQSNH